ncbi:hypothetical protein B0H14DRAFT_3677030 [Mycena olivaceomarginata]|nr:hypothetical protein B0H14DRAFT_3677030 [Mycena olivaceomarginata]
MLEHWFLSRTQVFRGSTWLTRLDLPASSPNSLNPPLPTFKLSAARCPPHPTHLPQLTLACTLARTLAHAHHARVTCALDRLTCVRAAAWRLDGCTVATPKDAVWETYCNATTATRRCGLYYKLDGSVHPISKSNIICECLPHDAHCAEASASVSEMPTASPDISRRIGTQMGLEAMRDAAPTRAVGCLKDNYPAPIRELTQARLIKSSLRPETRDISYSTTMGIEGFWACTELILKYIAAHSAQVMSLKDLNAREGNGRSTKAIVVGVDASLATLKWEENPELRALFYKLASLSDAQVITVFVFDGQHRPSTIRNKKVLRHPHWLVEEFTELIELFGFYFYTALGEGEAEIAPLSKHGFVDAVLTDDGDTALFGTRRIFRKLNKKNKDEITVYTSEALQNNPDIKLTNGEILLLAVLNGGDYDTVGLAKCGATIAHALAWCGFGDSLLKAAQNMSQPALQHLLVAWCHELREELKTTSQGHLQSKQPSLARTIPNNFPNLTALSLYSYPTTSWSEGFFLPITDSWIVKLLSCQSLLCTARGSLDGRQWICMFAKRITLPFDINTQLYEHVVLGRVQEEHPPLSAFLSIVSYDAAVPPKYKLKLSVAGLTNWMISRLEAPVSAAGPASATTQWFCAPAVEHYFTALVARFNGASIPAPTSAAAEAHIDVFDILDIPVFPAAPLPRWLGLIELSDSEEEGSSKANIIDLTLD